MLGPLGATEVAGAVTSASAQLLGRDQVPAEPQGPVELPEGGSSDTVVSVETCLSDEGMDLRMLRSLQLHALLQRVRIIRLAVDLDDRHGLAVRIAEVRREQVVGILDLIGLPRIDRGELLDISPVALVGEGDAHVLEDKILVTHGIDGRNRASHDAGNKSAQVQFALLD